MCLCWRCWLGRVLAATQGFYDPKSKLVFRALAVKERRLDDALIAARLQRALQLRQCLFKGSTTTGKLAGVLLTNVDYCCSRVAPRQAGLVLVADNNHLLPLCWLSACLNGSWTGVVPGWYESVQGCDHTSVVYLSP